MGSGLRSEGEDGVVKKRFFGNISAVECAKMLVSSLGVSIALFFVSVLLTGAMIGASARSALFDCYDGSNECQALPYLPVRELEVQKNATHASPNYIDVFMNAMYSANPEAQEPSSVGAKVFHGTTWDYDGYYLPQGRNSRGQESLLYVDTAFLRSTAIFACAVSSGLFCLVLFGLRVRGGRDAFKREGARAALEASFANASHELKTPLMAIRGYTESIRDGAIEEGFALTRIDAAVDRMADTVDGILRISKSECGLRVPSLGMWDVREIVFDEARMIEEACRRKDVRLIMAFPQPIMHVCDQELLSVAFLNILGNACRHAESYVRVSVAHPLRGEIELFFDNDGPSSSSETVVHAFDRFYKGPSGSTGIGLALSQEYIELMGGEIEMIAMPFGTRVRVKL